MVLFDFFEQFLADDPHNFFIEWATLPNVEVQTPKFVKISHNDEESSTSAGKSQSCCVIAFIKFGNFEAQFLEEIVLIPFS